ncbi:MFS transporter [bacterium]|nr:MFS transporter [bacterium]
MKKNTNRNITALSAASFFNDLVSDLVYPVFPLVIASLTGTAAPVVFGAIEGVAEAVSSILKYLFGRLSDATGKKKIYALSGYLLSNISRPFIGFASSWVGILFLRVSDRIGKGIRTAPRDSLLSASAGDRGGWAFSIHRAADNAGALFGAILVECSDSQIL